ncbi:MAG: anaerobic ribonucleoside-triphosphate reductase activating protein [bacterium]|nr:anaerobic ribonucleoside-triphosphate reductase activating protein [bacterium]
MNSEYENAFRGLQKTSLIDFPGHVASVFFVGGCQFRCPYCHNGPLVRKEAPEIPWSEVWAFLEKRKATMDGVCISGGEPTTAPFLLPFIRKVKSMGFKVKLDTNGYEPDVLASLFFEGLLDYVAMDIKNCPAKYAITCGLLMVDLQLLRHSVELIKSSGVAYEFRTTVCRELHTVEDMEQIGLMLGGGEKYVLQKVQDKSTLSGGRFTAPSPAELAAMQIILQQRFKQVVVR